MEAPNNIAIGDKVLLTCDNWFFAPDGQTYRAVFGTVRAIRTAEDALGVRPNGKSTNWYVEVGSMTIAGCQVHYVLKTDKCFLGSVKAVMSHEGRYTTSSRPSEIYDADAEA
jgi:hypothetical protein